LQRRVKIETRDEEGTRYTVALEGRLTRDKVMRAMDLIEMMNSPLDSNHEPIPTQDTFFGKLFALIESSFSGGEFSSSDIAREFEEKYNQPVKLATISTYLSRLAERDYLRRQRFGNSWVYSRVYLKASQLADK